MIQTDQMLRTRYPYLYGAERYVFVVTYGRSGSTLLQHVLNRMPAYCIRGENANVLPYFAQAGALVQKSEPMGGIRWTGEITGPGHPWYGAERIDPLHFRRAMADLFVRDILTPPVGSRVLGFKEIRYHTVGGDKLLPFHYMREIFPDARFIINTRSHTATAQSGWWKSIPFETVQRELAEAEAFFERIASTFPRVTLKLHYDDYVARPEEFKRLFDFLGEPYDWSIVERSLGERLTHTGVKQGS